MNDRHIVSVTEIDLQNHIISSAGSPFTPTILGRLNRAWLRSLRSCSFPSSEWKRYVPERAPKSKHNLRRIVFIQLIVGHAQTWVPALDIIDRKVDIVSCSYFDSDQWIKLLCDHDVGDFIPAVIIPRQFIDIL